MLDIRTTKIDFIFCALIYSIFPLNSISAWHITEAVNIIRSANHCIRELFQSTQWAGPRLPAIWQLRLTDVLKRGACRQLAQPADCNCTALATALTRPGGYWLFLGQHAYRTQPCRHQL